MRWRVVLLLWFIGVIFPLAWLGRFSLIYRRAFNAIFGPQWMHILMHTALYAGLALLLFYAFKLSLKPKTVIWIALIILGTAALQESAQWISQEGFSIHWQAVRLAAFDLLVDLTGGSFALILLALARLKSAHPPLHW